MMDNKQSDLVIMGIDPGTNVLGYSIIRSSGRNLCKLAIESPFFGKNIQSAIKLGRAQGVAIAAAIERDLVVHEYPPTKVKLAITGNGSASKEQVAGMLAKIFKIDQKSMGPFLDATDALAIAYCHHTQRTTIVSAREYSTWSAFVKSNPARVTRQSGRKTTKPSNPDQ